MAEWLNTAFSGLDGGMFRVVNSINCGFLNFFTKYFSFLGEKGIPLLLIGLVLCCFSKTRRIGANMILAIAVGALFTNVIIKNAVGRARPFTASQTYQDFWQQAGAVQEGEYSFPSGHTTATTAFAVALFLSCDKKWSWIGLVGALIMGFCRIYLVVHYTTDVIAGFIVGTAGGVIAFYLVKLIYKWLNKNPTAKFNKFALEWNVSDLFTKDKKVDKKEESQDLEDQPKD